MSTNGRHRRWGRAATALVVAAVALVAAGGPAGAHDTCGQPTNVRVATAPNIGTLVVGSPPLVVPASTTLIFTGVVHAGTVARWGLYDPVTQRRFFYTTQPARSNCVIHQEAEMVPAATVGAGTYEVWVIVIRWEDNPAHVETSLLVGTLTVNQA